jgi:hypothetical protein
MNERKTARLPGFSACLAISITGYPASGHHRENKYQTPEFVTRILGPQKARKSRVFSGSSTIYTQNLPTNSDEEA